VAVVIPRRPDALAALQRGAGGLVAVFGGNFCAGTRLFKPGLTPFAHCNAALAIRVSVLAASEQSAQIPQSCGYRLGNLGGGVSRLQAVSSDPVGTVWRSWCWRV
jgi:hypothetical protein